MIKGLKKQMKGIGKKAFSLILTFVMLMSMCMLAFSAESNSFEYEIISGSTSVRITGYKGSAENVTIPDIINGRTVVEISASAFSGNSTVKNLIISSNVTKILKEAFKNCSSLESVSIPASVTSIGDSAFANCVSLVSVTISSASTAIGYYAFDGCTSLKSITIPSSKIGYASFRNCTALESINLLDSVQSVGRYAFEGTAWLKSQPSGVVTLGKVVYSYTGNGDEALIPDGMLCIADYAFAEADVKSVIIPDSLYYIGLYAFYGCSELIYLSVPESVISIGTNAIGYDTENNKIDNFTIYCYDGSTAKNWADGNSITSVLINNCEHLYSDWIVTVEPDCLSAGEKFQRCIMCNSKKVESVDALGHSWSGWILYSEMSCTSNEIKQRTCTACGETEENISFTQGHVWTDWVVNTQPNCSEKGEQIHECSVCGEIEKQEIPALGHTWTVDDTTDENGWIVTLEPTCSVVGNESRVCSICNEIEVKDIDALGHTADEWTVIKDPTTITVGIKEGICTVCGETFTADIDVLTEVLPDDVTKLSFTDDASIYFNETRTCLMGVNGSTTVADVLLQFNYPSYIIITDSELNQLNNNDYVPTGGYIILVRYNEETQKYDPIDTVYLVAMGDVNCDGDITAADARLVLRNSANLESFTDIVKMAADVDNNGEITAADARKVLRVSAGLESL